MFITAWEGGGLAACDVLSGPVSIWSEAAKLPVPGSRGVWQVWQGVASVAVRSVETCAMRSVTPNNVTRRLVPGSQRRSVYNVCNVCNVYMLELETG